MATGETKNYEENRTVDNEISLVQLEFACQKCGQVLEVAKERTCVNTETSSCPTYSVFELRDVVMDYLLGKEECCPNQNCRRKLDWWRIISTRIRTPKDKYVGFLLTGAQITNIKFLLQPDQPQKLVFERYGIPREAKILSLDYLMDFDGVYRVVMPLEHTIDHGGPIRRDIPHSVWLEPKPVGADNLIDKNPKPTYWNAIVAWIPPTLADGAVASLATAFHALAEGRLMDVPIPAQVAVEGTLRDLLTSILSRHMSKDKTREMLVKSLTFNQQLNALYPLVLGLLNLPMLPSEIRGGVSSLAQSRNSIAHGSGENADIVFADIANGLAANLVAFKHIRHIQEMMAAGWPGLDQREAPMVGS